MSVLAGPTTQGFIKLKMSKQDYVTGMETCEFTYEWTIEKFSQRSTKNIKSPNFSSDCSDFNDEWFLEINPERADHHYLSVVLELRSFNNTSPLQTKCNLSVNNENEGTKAYNFGNFPGTIRWDTSRSNFSNTCYYSQSQNVALTICCTITMTKKQINNCNGILSNTSQLTADLKKLLLNEQSTDVTIKVGQKSFRAIKGILGARSPVFAAMFNHKQFKENKNNEVVIEDIDENVFGEFLLYIYTDETPNIKQMAMELLAVAEKYQVDRLKNICEDIICKMINVDNFAIILVCSDKYNLKKLNKKCLEFLKKNKRAVLLNETFKVYKKKHPQVFLSVLEHLLLA
ncbi:speckle-type POZ protein-like B [Aphidius gifuensis]|uniref:speckle-type POZ protein-like B n=1 Tax=Aphidius gifuensis TaxID=684658 RepID=UPI001CDB86EF|nr:speckle-type POZ protein-like B [Aphidius gifuensis]